MARICQITGKRPMAGNNVSHANNRTRRRFLPNLHSKSYWVPSLQRKIKLLLSLKGMRYIDLHGIEAAMIKLKERGESY